MISKEELQVLKSYLRQTLIYFKYNSYRVLLIYLFLFKLFYMTFHLVFVATYFHFYAKKIIQIICSYFACFYKSPLFIPPVWLIPVFNMARHVSYNFCSIFHHFFYCTPISEIFSTPPHFANYFILYFKFPIVLYNF